MAVGKQYDFSVVELNWLRKSLEFQRAGVVRSRAKEDVGSEVYSFRSKEIDAINALLAKL